MKGGELLVEQTFLFTLSNTRRTNTQYISTEHVSDCVSLRHLDGGTV